jgi:hypothetical protein
MLLDDKIEEILSSQTDIEEVCTNLFTTQTEIQGLVNTKNYVLIDILFYLLNSEFSHDNINLGLYRCLNHLVTLVTSASISSTSTYSVEVPPGVLTLSESSIDFGEVKVGDTVTESFTMSATGLTNSIYLTAPTKFTLSIDEFTGFTQSLLFIPNWVTTSIPDTIIYIKYTPTEAADDDNTLEFVCTDLSDESIDLLATGIVSTVVPDKSSLTFSNVNINTTSTEQTIELVGTNLDNNVTVSVSSDFQISLTSGSGYTDSIVLIPTDGSFDETIYVIFNPLTVSTYIRNITIEGIDIETINIPLTGNGVQATTNVSISELDFVDTYTGSLSAYQSFTVSGIYLLGNIVLTAPTGYKVSLASGSGYSSSVTLTPTSGVVTTTTIYCKFEPVAAIEYTGVISVVSTTAETYNIDVSGTGIEVTITSSESLLAFGNQNLNIQSDPLSFSISGEHLLSNIVLVAPTKFLISTNSLTGYTDTINLAPTSGIVTNTTIYCVFTPTVESSLDSTITINSTSYTESTIQVTGTGVVATLESDKATIAFSDTGIGETSEELSFTLTGTYLVGNVTVKAPAKFSVSLTSSGPYTSQVIITPELDGSTNTEVFVVTVPTATGAYSGNLQCKTSTVSDVIIEGTCTGINAEIEYTTAGTYYWTCPTGITTVDAIVIGGGGGGSGLSATTGATPGGAGGQCVLVTATVVPGRTYTIRVAAATTSSTGYGATGNVSYIYNPYTPTSYFAYARGGAGATASAGVGSTSLGIGDTVYKGGNGAVGTGGSNAGGGGGGAGSTGNGSNASGGSGGAGTSLYGGSGADTSGNGLQGNEGNAAGGGGSGVFATSSSTIVGGAGAKGYIKLVYG